MKFYGVLVLLVTLSAAHGFRCYVCVGVEPKYCTEKITCPAGFDSCAKAEVNNLVTKSCFNSAACKDPVNCCKGDLCNSAIPTGSSVLLLLVSSAITSVFL